MRGLRPLRLIVCGLGLLAGPLRGQSLPGSLESLTDLWSLPRLDGGGTSKEWSAARGFVGHEGDRCVLAAVDGPGVITRIWLDRFEGRLLLTIDGETAPRLDLALEELFAGKREPFVPPLAVRAGGAGVCVVPLGFARSARVELAGGQASEGLGWSVQASQYPEGTEVRPFRWPPSAEEKQALRRVVDAWSDPAAGLVPPNRTNVLLSRLLKLAPDEVVPFLDEAGPGVVLSLRIYPILFSPSALRGLIFQASWEGNEEPSISVPVADFFGASFAAIPWAGVALGWDQRGGYCQFVMPFAKAGRLSLTNRSGEALEVRTAVLWRPGGPLPGGGRFHAELRSSDCPRTEPMEFAAIPGPGRLVGMAAALQGITDFGYLHGGTEIFVDDGAAPAFVTRRTEELFGAGAGFGGGAFGQRLHACLRLEDSPTWRAAAIRLMITDAIPFTGSLIGRLHHGVGDEARDVGYRTVAYWYSAPVGVRALGAFDHLPTRQWVIRPEGWSAPGELHWSGPVPVRLETWESFTEEYRGVDRPLLRKDGTSGFDRAAPAIDARVALFPAAGEARTFGAEVSAAAAGRYELGLRFVSGRSGPVVEVRLDGKALGRVATLRAGAEVLEPALFGPLDLEAGAHRLELVLAPVEEGAVIGLESWRLRARGP